MAYEDGRPARITTVVLSAQHTPNVRTEALREALRREVILPVLPPALLDEEPLLYINPTGRFVIGGPAGDAGLTGRKAVSDAYGGAAHHGGGSLAGKDPTKWTAPGLIWPASGEKRGGGRLSGPVARCGWPHAIGARTPSACR